MRWLPVLLCFNAGFVDTTGFVSLGGLFSAHVTGNIVTIAAALAQARAPELGKVIALPVFAVVVIGAHLLGRAMQARGRSDFRILMGAKLVLLAHAALVAVTVGPFYHPDAPNALMTGMTLVSAMALQNALHRTHLKDVPPSTMMTGTFTQLLVDGAALWQPGPDSDRAATRARLGRFAGNFAAFVAGCALAALLHLLVGMWCMLVPPLVAMAEIFSLPPEEAGEATAA
ncbi:YoaK family protein [Xanthobacter sp. V3C-3]|uniref:YoaK family protein n=1 Tax=Xanthobacter lutulentifluminis TaxID=3119935 RepID=UPI003729B9F7